MNKYSQAQLNPTAYAHVENYVPPPAQFADKPPKKKIKFVKKKKSPAQAKQPRKIKFKVKPKPKSELEKRTGLNKEKANELEVLALMGMLPPELKKKILTPSETGVKVGGYKAKDILSHIKESEAFYERKDEVVDNMYTYAYQYQDYDDFIKKSRDRKFFEKASDYLRRSGNRLEDFKEDDIYRYEAIEEEIRDNMLEEAGSVMEKQLGVWAETQGNTTGSLQYFINSFNEHMFNY